MQWKAIAIDRWQNLKQNIKKRPVSAALIFGIFFLCLWWGGGEAPGDPRLEQVLRLGWQKFEREKIHCSGILAENFFSLQHAESSVEFYASRGGEIFLSPLARLKLERLVSEENESAAPIACQKISSPSRIEEI